MIDGNTLLIAAVTVACAIIAEIVVAVRNYAASQARFTSLEMSVREATALSQTVAAHTTEIALLKQSVSRLEGVPQLLNEIHSMMLQRGP